MADYDDAGYYEIQLNNKQLVFFFMAGLAIAVVIFLCGVMVGRGVRDASLSAAETSLVGGGQARPSLDTPRSTENRVRRELDYPERLESTTVDDRLEESSSPETLVSQRNSASPPAAATRNETARSREEAAAALSSTPSTRARVTPSKAQQDASGYTIQVVALKTRDAAENLVSRLENRGYPAYLESGGSAGLYRVRVGRFDNRAEAEKVASDLRETEKFKPYITH